MTIAVKCIKFNRSFVFTQIKTPYISTRIKGVAINLKEGKGFKTYI